ncbi:MAG TPA: DNA replication and repair protein RecF [Candidatus Coprenecus stercoravium]|uniref:DNA replication and repair protein RecF n=1 Tax=Candidatus Coprenecus stercoravium TaxID=2840735 RepID=A0A9D2GRF4_9BACT|nr:DNA replication and repair protein RecF [Candidatus Coprenecus stercoravium]
MYLKRIIVSNFKNVVSADVTFSPKINCICGDNGEGKTNFLDAVYYLSMTKSFLSSTDRYTFTYGERETVLHGSYGTESGTEDIAVSVRSDGNKSVRRNDKAYKRVSDHIGRIPVVMTSPSDISLINDSGEERRRFLNMMISQMDQEYLRAVMAYGRLLRQRNSLLKQEPVQDMLLDTVSERMYGFSETVYKGRSRAAEMLCGRTESFYNMISGGKEHVELRYRSDLSGGKTTSGLFDANRQRDKIMGYTTAGVQRDDLEFMMDGYPVRRCSSQGQQKSFLIALKMAQYSVMKEEKGLAPILLFDDLFDKLDAGRVASLIRMVVEGDFGQIFITDTDEDRLRKIVGGITDQGKFFNVCKGQVRSSSENC